MDPSSGIAAAQLASGPSDLRTLQATADYQERTFGWP
jgi:hypothetical protein